jgi:outer membrane protein TolC
MLRAATLAVCALASSSARAAPASQAAAGTGLTLEHAVSLALARAPELKALHQREAADRARVKQARSAYLPRVGLEARYLAHWPKNELPIDLSTLPFPAGTAPDIGAIDDIHHFDAELKVQLRLFDLARGARVDAARQATKSSRAGRRDQACRVGFAVRMTFLAALYARDVARIAGVSLAQARREEERARLRQGVGTGTAVGLAQARIRVASLTAQQAGAQVELARQRQRLASLIGVQRLPALRGDLAQLAQGAPRPEVTNHPMLAQLAAAERAAKLSAKSVSRTLVPTLSLFANAGLQYPRALQLELGPVVSAGAVLSWSIFDGQRRSGQVAEAEAKARSLHAKRRAARDELQRRLIDAQSKVEVAKVALKAARETLKHTRVYLRVAKAAVASGTGTDLDVHNAELGVDRAQMAEQKALFDAASARAQLVLLAGDDGRSVQ